MRWALISCAVLLSVCTVTRASAAQRPHYGGELLVHVFGPPLSLNPQWASTVADRTAQAAVYEPLYTLGAGGELEPVLADGPPQVTDRTVFVPLRQGVRLHDGRRLTPQLAAQALKAKLHTAGAHVLAPLSGFQQAYAGRGTLGITADVSRHGLRFELIAPYEAFPRLLASSHAAITLPSARNHRQIGTGPFTLQRRSKRGDLFLKPFLQHWRGRPYLDRLVFRVQASRSGAVAWARRAQPSILLGVPDARAVPKQALTWAPRLAPLSRTVLRVGPPQLRPFVQAALGRKRLVRRFMDSSAQPSSTLVPLASPPAAQTASGHHPRSVDLVVSRKDRASWQFAQRLQLNLLRSGISATLRRVDGDTLKARLKSPGEGIILASLLPDAPQTEAPSDALHTLLSIAAAQDQANLLSPQDLLRFFTASPEGRADQLPVLEARIRDALGLVVIALRAPGLMLQTPARGIVIDGRGALRLEDAFVEGAPP